MIQREHALVGWLWRNATGAAKGTPGAHAAFALIELQEVYDSSRQCKLEALALVAALHCGGDCGPNPKGIFPVWRLSSAESCTERRNVLLLPIKGVQSCK